MTTNPARWFDSEENRMPITAAQVRPIPGSSMFLIRDGLEQYSKTHPGSPAYDASQGDGGASLGGVTMPALAATLPRFNATTGYGLQNGSLRVRQILLERFWKMDRLQLTPEHVILCNGGRDALLKWYKAIHARVCQNGHAIMTSSAPWISYAHGTYLEGFNLLCAAQTEHMNFRITPEGIDEGLRVAGDVPVAGLILTTPDNPTGTHYTPDEIRSVINHAYKRGIRHILIDAIYQLVIDESLEPYDWPDILGGLDPEVRTSVTLMDGLTKCVGASNVRMAHMMCGDLTLANTIKNHTTHGNLPNLLGQAAAFEVYESENVRKHPWVKRITVPTSESRNVFNEHMRTSGHEFIAGQGYYGFVNVKKWVGTHLFGHHHRQITSVDELGAYLAREYGIAVVHGTPFLQPDFIRFSYALPPDITKAALHRFDQALKSLH